MSFLDGDAVDMAGFAYVGGPPQAVGRLRPSRDHATMVFAGLADQARSAGLAGRARLSCAGGTPAWPQAQTRRAPCLPVDDLWVDFVAGDPVLRFSLLAGAFATSVLRELVWTEEA